MQKVTVDGNQVSYIDLTAQEEQDLLADIATRQADEKTRGRKEAKRVIIGKLTELREMKQNRQIFSQQDLDEKQVEIDDLLAIMLSGE